ncbi:MAG: hypothetical protein CVV64_18505 [Candidatus Wallbacteria bacterium HGW-Wallbacteria-1]|jgi:DNA-binding transcriptional regulator YhcF (GntR family)|uniref:HTH gntR-type domain-containing protein n=1 Tax=Candidatus Wallbacteria bacterium HGW-Wallbacteria-1 TaxID=2013854 RepID=A0A2N1PJK5_9BACT|nr:MAG: hypothetical protein CVV64_18505 [Candidatus Wallbacteria bacterium HGW-Wallbacteria-1]
MISVDFNSPVPVPDQLIQKFCQAIETGIYQINEKIPSASELAERLRIHPDVVRQAYLTMQNSGLIEMIPDQCPKIISSPIESNWTIRATEFSAAGLNLTKLASARGFSRTETEKHISELLKPVFDSVFPKK